MRLPILLLAALLATPLAAPLAASTVDPTVTRSYGFSTLGSLLLPPDFPNFPYVEPESPKGGEVALSAVGTFDSFNPFILRGTAASQIGRVYDTLLADNADEASAAYGHLAQTVEYPADRSYVAFELRPEARFNDGTPVTAEDVVWTFDTLREKGRPNYREYYGQVKDAVAESPSRVVFRLKPGANREMPLILGQLAVLPKHWWAGRDFASPLTEPPLGSGPYRVGKFEFGRTVTYERVPNWWAANLPTGKGLYNFDTVRVEYFRDATVALEAFKAGQIDFRQETIAKQWATAYDFPAVQRGLVKKEEVRHHLPTGMQGFAMNTRRPIFQDRLVREALAIAFDFEWANKNLFFNSYVRTESFFSNSDFASAGLPQGAELALLEPFRDKLPPALFTTAFKLPVTDGSGNNRAQLKQALSLLEQAGWTVKGGKLVGQDGRPFTFEILLDQPAFERVANPYVKTLERLGMQVSVRTVDPAQFQKRTDAYDFDMTVMVWPESESPGNEQTGFWTCGAAKQEGGDNLAGVCDPVVDALVARVVAAGDREQLLAAVHALDRVLLWGWYVVPQWHIQTVRMAYWDRFARPDKTVRTGIVFDDWWLDPTRAAATDAARRGG